jgi:hypothetical protein
VKDVIYSERKEIMDNKRTTEKHIRVDGFSIQIHTHFAKDSIKHIRDRAKIKKTYDTCPFCSEPISEGNVSHIVPDCHHEIMFPDIHVHTDCLDQFITDAAACMFLRKDWNEALKRSYWFK